MFVYATLAFFLVSLAKPSHRPLDKTGPLKRIWRTGHGRDIVPDCFHLFYLNVKSHYILVPAGPTHVIIVLQRKSMGGNHCISGLYMDLGPMGLNGPGPGPNGPGPMGRDPGPQRIMCFCKHPNSPQVSPISFEAFNLSLVLRTLSLDP